MDLRNGILYPCPTNADPPRPTPSTNYIVLLRGQIR